VGRTVGTIIGLAILAGGAIWVGRQFLEPAQEMAEADSSVLSGAYEARLEECRVLAPSELPDGLRPPKVGEAFDFVLVAVLYPEREQVPTPELHHLDRIDGLPGTNLHPVHTYTETASEGAFLEVIFRVDEVFDEARLMRGEEVVLRQLRPE
jgi:hypothetical protein